MSDNIMRFEKVLPPDFDGVFRFSNPFDEDFIGTWAKKEYLFPAGTMTPLIIPEHSPLEIQHIRKKMAYDLAVREFFKSKSYKGLSSQEGKPGNRTFSSFQQAGQYTLSDLEPYIKKCLTPLKESEIMARPMQVTPVEDKLKRNDDGSLQTEAIDQKTSLRQKALNA